VSESTEKPTTVQADTAKQETAKQETTKQENDKATAQKLGVDKMAIQMLNDRLLVKIPDKDGERRSMGGILIPATAQVSKRLVWAEVVALGQNVRSCEVGDQVLFGPEDRYEVEVSGVDYIMLRERDIHAVAASRIDGHTGLYL
jgi:chaperonin GroES